MDPDAALSEGLDAARAVLNDEDEFYPDNLGQDAVKLAEAFIALHEHIDKGGFLPAAWRATAGGHFYGMSGAEVGGE